MLPESQEKTSNSKNQDPQSLGAKLMNILRMPNCASAKHTGGKNEIDLFAASVESEKGFQRPQVYVS